MKLSLLITLFGCVVYVKAGVFQDRFTQQYNKIKNKDNGYFSSKGVPYYAAETFAIEAPDYGHETLSEDYCYWIWLEAVNGALTGDFSSFNKAWQSMEDNIIPKMQSGNKYYNAEMPTAYVATLEFPEDYPSLIDFSVPVGRDPIAAELESAYGNKDIYSMHWLLDSDNVYGFGVTQGECETGPGKSRSPSFINSFERGPNESPFNAIPHPACDSFKFGGQHGFVDLFTKTNNYSHQWKYAAAPDSDARVISATYWASIWADAKGKKSEISSTLSRAGKLGDYLRYSLFDKHFKKIGNCIGAKSCPGGIGKESAHYLISWWYAWGGSYNEQNGWAFRSAHEAVHFGFQNPLAAWVLSQNSDIRPQARTAQEDWGNSLKRQLEFYNWLQSSEGAFAAGATNNWNGRYDTPPSNSTQSTFHGMFYDSAPSMHDPPSSAWYFWQAWAADRLAQYYYVTGDSRARSLLDKWISWADRNIQVNGTKFSTPVFLEWSGVPPNTHVKITAYGQDVGTAAATARAFIYYAAKTNNSTIKNKAKQLLDALWAHQDKLGVSFEVAGDSYKAFTNKVTVPAGWKGKYPNGETIDSNATFIGIRSFYKNDPDWDKVDSYLKGGPAPKFKFHIFASQADFAISMGIYSLLFNE